MTHRVSKARGSNRRGERGNYSFAYRRRKGMKRKSEKDEGEKDRNWRDETEGEGRRGRGSISRKEREIRRRITQ
jgi:hypothetical protein